MSGSLHLAGRVLAAGLTAAVVFLAGYHLSPGAAIPSDLPALYDRVVEVGGALQIDVAPEFRDRVPDRDSSLRWYRPYPE